MHHEARRGRTLLASVCALGLGLLLAAPAASQQAAPAARDAAALPPQPQPRSEPRLLDGGGKIIVLDEEVIEGRIQKPEAFYILQRSNLNYKSLELDTSFIPKIVDSVKKSPF
ncbi:MAG: hypothetical protein FJ125_00370 [Deltaproteobacteria bacterium]|nr:hypothetical protein [Deltaproteobacteria bacterium]